MSGTDYQKGQPRSCEAKAPTRPRRCDDSGVATPSVTPSVSKHPLRRSSHRKRPGTGESRGHHRHECRRVVLTVRCGDAVQVDIMRIRRPRCCLCGLDNHHLRAHRFLIHWVRTCRPEFQCRIQCRSPVRVHHCMGANHSHAYARLAPAHPVCADIHVPTSHSFHRIIIP